MTCPQNIVTVFFSRGNSAGSPCSLLALAAIFLSKVNRFLVFSHRECDTLKNKIRITLLVCISIVLLFVFSNAKAVIAQENTVVINEFLIQPDSAQWVEIYNKGNETVDIGGWVIDDDGSPSTKFTIPDAVSISPGEFQVFESGQFNFNYASADCVRLIKGSEEIDKYSYINSPGENRSIGRSPDGSDNWVIFPFPTKGITNGEGESIAPTPTPTPSPTPTTTPAPISKATCIIKPQDETGEEFVTGDRVKIYINDKYIGHYAPETLEFCDGCFCDDEKQVSCGFGSHTIRLEKSGYHNYTQTINLSPGGLETIAVSMTPEDDGDDSNPTPTKTPTPKPTATPTKKTTPTPTGSISPTPVPTGEVLGDGTEAFLLTSQPTPTATAGAQDNTENKALPLVFLASSLVFLFTGGIWLWNNQILKG